MARVFTDGAEFGDNVFFSNPVLLTAATDQVRSGAYSYKFAATSTPSSSGIPGSPLAELYYRQGVRVAGFHDSQRIIRWFKGTTELGNLRLNTITGLVQAYTSTGTLVATGTHPISANNWYLIEVHVKIGDSPDGIIQVKIDGVLDIDFSGDTKPGTDADVNGFGWVPGPSHIMWIDDLALNDVAGGVDDSWCGDGRIIRLSANGNGDASDFDGSDGNQVDNYLLVDEIISDGDTTYVQSSTLDERDLYNLSASGLVATQDEILRVYGEVRARDTGSAGNLIAMVVKTGGTEYASADVALPSAYGRVVGAAWKLNPNTAAAWTPTELDALQSGPKVRS